MTIKVLSYLFFLLNFQSCGRVSKTIDFNALLDGGKTILVKVSLGPKAQTYFIPCKDLDPDLSCQLYAKVFALDDGGKKIDNPILQLPVNADGIFFIPTEKIIYHQKISYLVELYFENRFLLGSAFAGIPSDILLNGASTFASFAATEHAQINLKNIDYQKYRRWLENSVGYSILEVEASHQFDAQMREMFRDTWGIESIAQWKEQVGFLIAATNLSHGKKFGDHIMFYIYPQAATPEFPIHIQWFDKNDQLMEKGNAIIFKNADPLPQYLTLNYKNIIKKVTIRSDPLKEIVPSRRSDWILSNRYYSPSLTWIKIPMAKCPANHQYKLVLKDATKSVQSLCDPYFQATYFKFEEPMAPGEYKFYFEVYQQNQADQNPVYRQDVTLIFDQSPPIVKNIKLEATNPVLLKGQKTYSVSWNLQESNPHPLLTKLYFSPDNGLNWKLIGEKFPPQGPFYWNTPAISCSECFLKLILQDRANLISSTESNLFSIDSTAPTISTDSIIVEKSALTQDLNLSFNVSDQFSKVSHFCVKTNALIPSPESSCWKPIEFSDHFVVVNNAAISLGDEVTKKEKNTFFLMVRDEQGNISSKVVVY